MTSELGTAVGPVARLVDQFHKLPGIGPKSAQRLTYHLIRMPEEQARSLAEAILAVRGRIVLCSRCYNITESDPCAICSDAQRDQGCICVVEEALDVLALERTQTHRGLYHVLHGVISPMNGVGPDDLKIPAVAQPYQRRRYPGDHPGDESESRGRGYVHVHPPADLAVGDQGDASRSRPPGGGRSGVRRRVNPGPGHRGPAGVPVEVNPHLNPLPSRERRHSFPLDGEGSIKVGSIHTGNVQDQVSQD